MKPVKNTAILVIHGIGEQNPYETLDAFVRNLWEYLLKENLKSDKITKVTGHHGFRPRSEWVEDFIELSLEKQATKTRISIYEYYWAHLAEGQVKLKEVYDWLIKTSDGASTFYNENVEIVKTYESSKVGVDAFENKRFKSRWYLKILGPLFHIISFLRIPNIPYIDSLIRLAIGKINQGILDYIGDVVLYTSADMKLQAYQTRKKILDAAVEQIKKLMLDDDNDQIIVAGHSLGSVIAFDALNRINHEMNVSPSLAAAKNRLTGFVTFGSPLDKIAFFFREHTPEHQDIRAQILTHFHGFKSRNLSSAHISHPVTNPYQSYLEHVIWINFWNSKDPVSGHLDFYRVTENIQIDLKKPWGLAHTEYWDCESMYEKIAAEFF